MILSLRLVILLFRSCKRRIRTVFWRGWRLVRGTWSFSTNRISIWSKTSLFLHVITSWISRLWVRLGRMRTWRKSISILSRFIQYLSYNWEYRLRCFCYLKVVEEEPELCFEEDKGGWSERSGGLVWIESAYEIGQYCFCMLLHLGLVEFKLG